MIPQLYLPERDNQSEGEIGEAYGKKSGRESAGLYALFQSSLSQRERERFECLISNVSHLFFCWENDNIEKTER